jgi:hypothetical protein
VVGARAGARPGGVPQGVATLPTRDIVVVAADEQRNVGGVGRSVGVGRLAMVVEPEAAAAAGSDTKQPCWIHLGCPCRTPDSH